MIRQVRKISLDEALELFGLPDARVRPTPIGLVFEKIGEEIERQIAALPTGDGSAALVPPPTHEQIEYDWMRWRGWRRLVGHEAFYFQWRSNGGQAPT